MCAACGIDYPARRRGSEYCSRACSSGVRRNDNYDHRRSAAYRRWRLAVLDRDGHRCQGCGVIGVRLHAHHIHDFATNPDLRLVLDNGLTLCGTCHSIIHGRRLTPQAALPREIPPRLQRALAQYPCAQTNV